VFIIRDENIWETWPNYQKSSLIHDFVTRSADRNAKLQDYGTGELYTAVEMHVLEKIYLNPGITVTEITKRSNRTKGAISQIVSKLEKKGLVMKTPQEYHGKRISLWPTAKGKQLSKAHIKFDDERTGEFFGKIAEHYTSEQIDAFFKITESMLCLLQPGGDIPWVKN
jgi:DNA-binding MarR family transcriptional regulator